MTISEFSRDATRRYLRSVVLIDDELFKVRNRSSWGNDLDVDGPPVLILNRDGVAPDLATMAIEPDDDEGNLATNDHWVDAKSVTEGFAKEGIVCGVYEPTAFPATDFEIDTNFKTLLTVCENADVFILDWHLFNGDENADAVAHLLAHIFKEDNSNASPKPIRFCAIYTAEPVDNVCGKVFSALKQIDEAVKQDRTARKVSAGGLTVCIYSKEEATASGAIAAKDLAEQIINDFAKTYEGIMPTLALRGIASIRDNAKRILDKFPAGMDPAFLLHAGLTIADKNISEDVVNLMGDEMSAVLADTQVSSDEIYDLCSDHIATGCDEAVLADLKADTALVPQETTWENIKEFFSNIFSSRGFPKKTDIFIPWRNEIRLHRIDRKLLMALSNLVKRKTAGDKAYCFGALSALFCHRTNYTATKMLRFGSVVKCLAPEENAGRYYLCLMPSCDSIRLKDRDKNGGLKNHKFPFWQLTEVPKDFQGRNHGLVLKGADGDYLPYCAKGKIRENFSLFEFNSQNATVTFDNDGIVKTTRGVYAFEWVAELKSAHIQRMAEFVSREFSRVGLAESEWLRLQVDR